MDASSSVYLRQDSDETTVWSPRVRVSGEVMEATRLESTYAIDAWSSASIDIRSSATRVVREVRHEVNANVSHQATDVLVAGSYRYSIEPDYESHGGVLGVALDLAEKNTTLDLAVFGSFDRVGREGDPGFDQAQNSVGGRFTVSQVLDRDTTLRALWETTYIAGFQSSPYRFVGLGGDGVCPSRSAFCIAEQVPEARFRHALGLGGRRALGSRLSVGLDYRFYVDSWGLQSQTLQPSFAWLAMEHGTLSLSYRYYTQGNAKFYRPRYFTAAGVDGYATRDRKLSAFYTHGAGLSYLHEFTLGGGGSVLRSGVDVGVMRYRYLAYVGLKRVDALEVTATLGVEFR